MPMTSNFPQFEASVIAALNGRRAEFFTTCKELGIEMLRRAMLRSPVDSGRYRASHVLTIDEEGTYIAPEREPGSGGERGQIDAEALNKGVQVMASAELKDGTIIYLTNNLVYAQRLEEGHSGQAPEGVYALTRQEMQEIINREFGA